LDGVEIKVPEDAPLIEEIEEILENIPIEKLPEVLAAVKQILKLENKIF
jgi:predicted house-cleaning noncanonical NTP pyrophosphatase (MazG superfamily)